MPQKTTLSLLKDVASKLGKLGIQGKNDNLAIQRLGDFQLLKGACFFILD